MDKKLNFREWLMSEFNSDDPLHHIKIIIDEPNNGIKAQMSKLQKMPAITQHFTNSNLQSLFTSFNAAISKAQDLSTRYKAFDVAAERVKDAYGIFRQLSSQIKNEAKIDFLSLPEGKAVVSDLNVLYKQFQRMQRSNLQMNQPTQDQNNAMRA